MLSWILFLQTASLGIWSYIWISVEHSNLLWPEHAKHLHDCCVGRWKRIAHDHQLACTLQTSASNVPVLPQSFVFKQLYLGKTRWNNIGN